MRILTDHLSYEHGFVSIITDEDHDNEDCGRIYTDGTIACSWRTDLGSEPQWFGPELDSLSELVSQKSKQLHAEYRDLMVQLQWDWLFQKGIS